jgi:imidazole glycerol phosphate synthase glutamine amidotransferase subunit
VIGVLDYGAGNLCSVANTLNSLETPFRLVTTAHELREVSKIILPGVGHFGQMMRALDAMNIREALVGRIRDDVPFLGICLGMHALFDGSDEAPDVRGLGIFTGQVKRFPESLRVPHMGWNQLRIRSDSRLFGFVANQSNPWFYFAHSFYLPEVEISAADCAYSLSFTAAVEYRNVFGVQFHPEKSGGAGQSLVRAFVTL